MKTRTVLVLAGFTILIAVAVLVSEGRALTAALFGPAEDEEEERVQPGTNARAAGRSPAAGQHGGISSSGRPDPDRPSDGRSDDATHALRILLEIRPEFGTAEIAVCGLRIGPPPGELLTQPVTLSAGRGEARFGFERTRMPLAAYAVARTGSRDGRDQGLVSGDVALPSPPPATAEIELSGHSSMRGRLTNSAGRPIEGFPLRATLRPSRSGDHLPRELLAELSLNAPQAHGFGHLQARTDQNGEFRFSSVPVGAYRFSAVDRAAGARWQPAASQRARWSPVHGGVVWELDWREEATTLALRHFPLVPTQVDVLDENGAPVPQASVQVYLAWESIGGSGARMEYPMTVTDRAGKAELQVNYFDEQAPPLTLRVTAAGHASHVQEVGARRLREPLRAALRSPGLSLTGRVVSEATSGLPSDIRVKIVHAVTDRLNVPRVNCVVAETTTEPDGTYRFDVCRPGERYLVIIEAPVGWRVVTAPQGLREAGEMPVALLAKSR